MREVFLPSLLILASAGVWAFFGRYYPDEPFYLYCGKLAWQGKLPYRDFLFTQMPLPLYIYGFLAAFVTSSLWAARALSAVLAWWAGIAACVLARRAYGRKAVTIATILMATGFYPMFHLILAKGYSLGALALTAAMVLLVPPLRGAREVIAAGCLMGAAVLVRITAAAALIAAAGWQVVATKSVRLAALMSCVAMALVAAVLLPFALADANGLWFGVWSYHGGTWLENPDPLRDWIVRFGPFWLTGAVSLATSGIGAGMRGVREVFWGHPATRALSVIVALLTALHMVAAAHRAEYHTATHPLMCVLASGWVVSALHVQRSGPLRGVLFSGLIAAALLGVLFTAADGTWIVIGYYPDPPRSVLTVVEGNSSVEDKILSLHPEISLQTGRDSVSGTELGVFGIMVEGAPFTEEDVLSSVTRRDVPVVVLREGDLDYLNTAALKRSGSQDYESRLHAALESGYDLKLQTTGDEEGRRRHLYEVWVRREKT